MTSPMLSPILQLLAYLVVIAAVLFLAAGDWRWLGAWVLLAEVAVLSMAIIVSLARHDPALLRERFAPPVHRDQAGWDKLFLLGCGIAFFGWMAFIAVDARRFAWSHVPMVVEALGALAIAAGLMIVLLTFRYNTFAVPQVRVQVERKQRAISDGPYAIVRHPMYSGTLLYFVGMPLLLGSWYGLIVAVGFAVALGMRTLGEERLLRRDLAGYDDYASRVRWRMVPGIW